MHAPARSDGHDHPGGCLIGIAVVATLVVAYLVASFHVLGVCGGSGGSPYAREGSQLAGACDRFNSGWVILAPPVVTWVGGLLSVALGRWEPFIAGLVVAVLLIAGPSWIIDTADANGPAIGAQRLTSP